MSRCPYTWFRGLFASTPGGAEASALRVTVERDGDETVNVALPARSARWLVDLIPDDVLGKIRAEQIPIDAIQLELAGSTTLVPRPIFELQEPARVVRVWLE